MKETTSKVRFCVKIKVKVKVFLRSELTSRNLMDFVFRQSLTTLNELVLLKSKLKTESFCEKDEVFVKE